MSDIQLSEDAQLALIRIGEAVADNRPDLNGDVSDSFIVSAALFALFALMYTEQEPSTIITMAFNAALSQDIDT